MSEHQFDPAAHARSMRASGFWVDKSFDEFLQQAVAATPGKLALLADRADHPEPKRLTYAELGDLVSRAAAALKQLGIGPRDVVSVQLPNWWEFAVIALAAFRVGAVVNPLMPIFREHELGYMLDFAEAKLLVVPKLFRGFDHEAMAQSLRPRLPRLQHIIAVDGEGANSFDQALLSGSERLGPPPIGEIGALPADQMAVLMFTSGTTGSPKGVMHCLNTLLACNIALAGRFGLDTNDTMLVCSPLGHMTGFAAGMLLGVKIGASVIFQDVWVPKRGIGIMANEGVAVKVLRMDGSPAPVGEKGLLKVRGAQMCLGYYKREDMEPFDAEGWFDTGDMAYMDDEGYIRIDGRIKDIIIRGGENVPVFDIENLLFKHPAVLSTAIVGYPDPRLGERACAFVVLRPGQTLDLADVQALMAEHKVAKQYWPERVEIVADLPKTPAGKVQKFQLREVAKAFAETPRKASA